MTIGRVHGVESYVLDPAETKKLYPLMNVEDLTGTLYCPGDGKSSHPGSSVVYRKSTNEPLYSLISMSLCGGKNINASFVTIFFCEDRVKQPKISYIKYYVRYKNS